MNKLPVIIKDVVKHSNIKDLTKAEQIASNYAPLMNEVTEQGNLLKKLEKGNEDDLKKAKRIKLDLGKICSRAIDQKKKDKDLLLLETRFIDNLFGAVNGAARLNQEEAKQIEQHFENLENERIEKLQLDRESKLIKYLTYDEIIPDFLGEMDDSVWSNYLMGSKTNYDNRIAAEEKAKKERIEAEIKEAARIKQLAIDNARLQKEAKEKEVERIKEEKERQRLAKIETDKQIAQIKRQREEAETLRKIQQQKIDDEKAKANKLAKELQDKKDDEAREEKQRLELIEAEANKGDVAKVKDLINDLNLLKSKYTFKAKKNQKMYKGVNISIDKITAWIETK